MHKSLTLLLPLALLLSCTGRPAEWPKTTFQTGQGWRPTLDTRADAVMVYGVSPTLEERLRSWQEKGYRTHFMTGIAWGGYQDYFLGAWDGVPHMDEGQVNQRGDTLWHGKNVPYIVPTLNYLRYFKERILKRVIDAGVDHIFLEEPEFWAAAGYSDAFKREWEARYGTPWEAPHTSPEAAFRSAELKYHLYYRALDEAFTYAKEYGRSLGRKIYCYVPTHSLINYTQWQIVSPEASLASLPSMDGYIAQVWTGTSRVPNTYDGVRKERIFETAFLEYGCMASMTAPTRRQLWFLTDPIEDRPRDWEDFARGYQATFTAQLLYPQVADYEIMPWPERIYERPYPVRPGAKETSRIPADYASMMQVMTNALQQMPEGDAPTPDISVLMANSLMFRRDSTLSAFFSLALPVLKRGIPVGITHAENLAYPKALSGVRVLLVPSEERMPLSEEALDLLRAWEEGGGNVLRFPEPPEEGKTVIQAIEALLGPLPAGNTLTVERGPYRVVAVMDESPCTAPYVAEGCLIDLYDPSLPVYGRKEVHPGSQALLYDVSKAGKAPRILAAASRAYEEKRSRKGFSYLCKGPADTFNVTRILLARQPGVVLVNGKSHPFEWDSASRTVFLRFPNAPEGVQVDIRY